jgi:hypothetical protein
MEDTPPPGDPDFIAQLAFDVDLQPMYALSEAQYQAIINQMSNLVVAVIEQYRMTRQGSMAQQIATHAHGILREYDDDVAEQMLLSAQPPQHRVQRGSIR